MSQNIQLHHNVDMELLRVYSSNSQLFEPVDLIIFAFICEYIVQIASSEGVGCLKR